MFSIGLTDHLEGPADRASATIYDQAAELVELADRLGVRYAWFTEHHGHAHRGHMPTPLLLALHLASRTRTIHLGTAIICLNLHHPIDAAEQAAVADVLTGGRMAIGFGSGSTPEEARRFGVDLDDEPARHARFAEALRVVLAVWRREPPHERALPKPAADLPGRSWVAVNSAGSARIAGMLGLNMLFSHLRTPEQYRDYLAVYHEQGGRGLVAANRPVFVGPSDRKALDIIEPALRTLWRRFRDEGKIPAETAEPTNPADLCAHPINFIVGGAETVAKELHALNQQAPFDIANLELHWDGLSHEHSLDCLGRLMKQLAG